MHVHKIKLNNLGAMAFLTPVFNLFTLLSNTALPAGICCVEIPSNSLGV